MPDINTRFTIDLSEEDTRYLIWLKESKRIKTYSDVLRPAISDRLSEMKTKEGYKRS